MEKAEKYYGTNPILRSVMTELNTVRGIAVLMVFLFHGFEDFPLSSPNIPMWEHLLLSALSLGWMGVNLFFVLSGFLITGILLDSVNLPQYYSQFYRRRALRILPAYYLLLAVLVFVGRLGFVQQHTSMAFVGLSLVYLSNITPLFGVPRDYAPLWSLAVEEHFYLIWPAAVRVLTKRVLTITAATICLCEPALRAFAVVHGGLWWGPYTWLSADGLALGALLAIFTRSKWGSRENLLKLAALSAFIGVMALTVSLSGPRFVAVSLRATSVNYYSLGALAFVLWIGTGRFKRLVNLRILSFYGFISYGFYLIHPLFFHLYNDVSVRYIPFFCVGHDSGKYLIRLLLILALTTVVAYVLRITYEEFFLRMKSKPIKQDSHLQPT
jgi:peptidoglycan/LPS O-acetylase OafA/YrhL